MSLLSISAFILGIGLGCHLWAAVTASPPPPKPVETNNVKMVGFGFEPKIIKIKKGTSVTWTNNSTTMHNVIFSFFRSRYLFPKDELSQVFDEVGTFDYYCDPHRSMGMVGTVIVEE